MATENPLLTAQVLKERIDTSERNAELDRRLVATIVVKTPSVK